MLKLSMINFNNTYNTLPERFFTESTPENISNPTLLAFNKDLAQDILELDLEQYSDDELAKLFTGQIIPDSAASIALAYAGHQFGNFVPQLGDGRAVLLGEILNSKNQRFDIQLKGSGRTVFSRGGDGKSSLGPVIREYIVSEAMYFLGVPTTRALAAATTGDHVQRETSIPGGVFTRVAASHIRVGTFEFFAARRDNEGIKLLTEYTIQRHYPEIAIGNNPNYAIDFLKAVAQKQSTLVAKWMSIGFIHGVMNTDNMSISGETIDYGPCAFMDNFSFTKTFSSIDRRGRYAYNNQLNVAKWNLSCLASCLIPLIDEDEKTAVNILEETFANVDDLYQKKHLDCMSKKFGIFNANESDIDLIDSFLKYLEEEDLDFTISFRTLTDEPNNLKQSDLFKSFFDKWQARLSEQTESQDQAMALMQKSNPVFIPRNHQVERAIQGAIQGDLTIFKDLIECSKTPYLKQTQFDQYTKAPLIEQRVQATFCGT